MVRPPKPRASVQLAQMIVSSSARRRRPAASVREALRRCIRSVLFQAAPMAVFFYLAWSWLSPEWSPAKFLFMLALGLLTTFVCEGVMQAVRMWRAR